MNINVLDCTLRDGGYINNWMFKDSQIRNVLNSLGKSNIEIVEYGYLNDTKGTSSDSTLFDSIQTIEKLIANHNGEFQRVVMINFGDYDAFQLPSKNATKIDGVRLAFHKKDLEDALIVSKHIISLGYKLFFQPMVTKNYKESEFINMIQKVNEIAPYSFYIVDSFGSMTLSEFQTYLNISDQNLDQNILLGYHSHNNMQLAFSNAINMSNAQLNRDIIIDASIYGIGRGAGNLNSELIADYLNTTLNKDYNTLPLLEIIDEFLNSLMKKNPWGFSPAQYLSASFNCHPNYATFLINKNTNHIVGVRKVLEKLPEEKKSSFDKQYIEDLYIEFLLEAKSEVKSNIDFPLNKKILLIASGKSVQEYLNLLTEKVSSSEYLVISLNHKSIFESDYYFFSNQKRFDEFYNEVDTNKIVISNNITSLLELPIVLDFKKLAFTNDSFVSNVAIVMLKYLILNGIKCVEIAGLDGYKIDIDNYSYQETSVINDNKALIEQNNIIQNSLKQIKTEIDIQFLTPSIFN